MSYLLDVIEEDRSQSTILRLFSGEDSEYTPSWFVKLIPIYFIIASILLLSYYQNTQTPSAIDWNGIPEDLFITSFIALLIPVVRQLKKDRWVHIPVVSGISFLLFTSADDLYDEFFISPTIPFGISIDKLDLIGLLIFSFGLLNWARILTLDEKIQRRVAEEFQTLVRMLPIGVVIFSMDEEILFTNDYFSRMMGYSKSEIENKKIVDFVSLVDMTKIRDVEDIVSQEGKFELELSLSGKQEITRRVLANFVPRKNPGGCLEDVLCVMSDITNQRQIEKKSQQQRRELELYASLLTHDLGNDLQVVLGYIEAIDILESDISKKAREMLHSAGSIGLRMAKVLKTFGSLGMQSEIDVIDLIKEIAKRAREGNRNLTINLSLSEDLPELYTTGGSLLPMVFENIIRNSSKYAGDNPIINISVEEESDFAVIRLSDNGPGIPENMKDRLFLRGTSSSGSGLGLYLSRQIVIACGGTLELDDTAPGRGAAFLTKIPLASRIPPAL